MEPLNLAALSMEFPKGVVYVLMRKYNFLEHALCIQQMVCVGPGCEFSSLHSMLHNCTVSPSSMAYYQLGGPIGYKLSPIRELGLYTKLNSPAPIFVLPLSLLRLQCAVCLPNANTVEDQSPVASWGFLLLLLYSNECHWKQMGSVILGSESLFLVEMKGNSMVVCS